MMCYKFAVLLVGFCIYTSIIAQNRTSHAPEILAEFTATGSAYRISNTLCGKLLLTKPSETSIEKLKDWGRFSDFNRVLCECGRYGRTSFKYAWYFMLLLLAKPNSVFYGSIATHNSLIQNRTLHLLLDYDRPKKYYTYIENGVYGSYWTSNMTQTLERKVNVVSEYHYFSYLLAYMVTEKISITFLHSSNSYWERQVNKIGNGLAGFVYDSSLPFYETRRYTNVSKAYAYFKNFTP